MAKGLEGVPSKQTFGGIKRRNLLVSCMAAILPAQRTLVGTIPECDISGFARESIQVHKNISVRRVMPFGRLRNSRWAGRSAERPEPGER